MHWTLRTIIAGLAVAAAAPAALAYDWLQFNGTQAHSGNNPLEKSLTRNNVASSTQLFQVTLPAAADGAPVVLRNVITASGKRDLVFLTTTAGHIVALDARTGAPAWSRQFPAGTCKINNGSNTCYTTSSPAIDPNRLYVYTYGLDGFVHKLQVGDGVEVMTGGWPQVTTLKGFDEKGSSALSFATSQRHTYLYMTHGGYPGDAGDYQGHVTAIDLATGAQKVFNTMCSNQAVHLAHTGTPPSCASHQSAMWARPGVIYHAPTDRILIGTGNGQYTGNTGGFNWSESLLALTPDGAGAAGKPIDAYTPINFQNLDNTDLDLGSTAPAILPVPPNAAVPHLAVMAGKDQKIRLLDLADLSGAGGAGNTGGEIGPVVNLPQGGVVLSQPAVWVNPADGSTWFFIANGPGISAHKIVYDNAGIPSISFQWQRAQGGTSPIVAANVLYYASGSNVRAMDPVTANPLWTSPSFGGTHWQSAVIANGVVYIADQSAHLTAFAPAWTPTDFDFDGGGKADLLWRDTSGAGTTALWQMNGTTGVGSVILSNDPDWVVEQVGDLSGDGRNDIVWHNTVSGEHVVWNMSGLTVQRAYSVLFDSATITHLADLDGDGDADMVWYDIGTGATGAAMSALGNATFSTDGNWRVVQTGDFNGDGRADLVWRNSATGATVVWLMDGPRLIGSATLFVDLNWLITAVADFNGDGKSDLVLRHASGVSALWLMDGTAPTGTAVIGGDSNWSVTRTADLDGDGMSDLIWYNTSTGTTVAWLMRGTSAQSSFLLGNDPFWRVTNTADFNGDGKSDLVWTNSSNGAASMWLMNGAAVTATTVLTGPTTWRVANPH